MEKIKVLLVEDEPTLAMIIKDTLDGERVRYHPSGEWRGGPPVMRRSTRHYRSGYHDAQDGWFHDGQIDP